MRRVLGITGIVFVAVLALLLTPWAFSFADPAPEQDDCKFGSVTNDEYRQLLRQAKAERWSVWPSLSNGIFWPSDRGVRPPTAALEEFAENQLLRFIRQLTLDPIASDQELAAAHAVMRSIKAEFVGVWNVPDFRQNGKLVRSWVDFNYYLPSLRFAPLCLFCLAWPHTNVRVVFVHDIEAGTYALSRVVVVYSGFKSDLKRERNTPNSCPAFPKQPHNT